METNGGKFAVNPVIGSDVVPIRPTRIRGIEDKISEWDEWCVANGFGLPSETPRWLRVFQEAFGHRPYCIEQRQDGEICSLLPLSFMQSRLFGRFLVGLPYLNVGGLLAGPGADPVRALSRAAQLADELNVRHLELRHQAQVEHPRFSQTLVSKVHMRLELPATPGTLWDQFKPKVRNQVRKAVKTGIRIDWGRHDRLDSFYDVFARNMRDLGTPVYGKRLFSAVLDEFPDSSEFCVAWHESKPVAAALLMHGAEVTEVPSASSIRDYNKTNANMLMYWNLLQRSIERKQLMFDFGRSTEGGATYKFKKQWGAEPHPANWQFYVRHGSVHSMRPESGRFSAAIKVWRKLPIRLTRLLGPSIIRGVP